MRELRILYSILLLSVSGALKLEFACEFLSKTAPQHYILSFAMIVYAAYSLDRGVKNREDEENSKKFRQFLLASSSFCMVISLIISQKPMLLLPFAASYLYSKGIKSLRLKSGKGVKNVVVAFTWAFCIALFLDEFSLQALIVCVFFFLKSFINTVLYDFKDVERDKLAGIFTLPTCTNASKLRAFLLFTNFSAHLLLLLELD